jgi:hypothetical protein
MSPRRTLRTYLSRPPAIVVQPTQADHVHRNLSTFGGKRLPARGLDPDPTDLDHLAAGPGLRMRQGRKSLIHQIGDHRDVEAMGGEKRLRRAVAARGCQHGESAALLGSQARYRHFPRLTSR